MPFSKADDFRVSMPPKPDTIKGELTKAIERAKELNDSAAVKQLSDIMNDNTLLYTEGLKCVNVEPTDNLFGRILTGLHTRCKLIRYQTMNFIPYGKEPQDLDPSVLNTYRPPPLSNVQPSQVDIKKTKTWEYFWCVLAFENKKQLRWWFNLISHIIQRPQIRTERIYVLASPHQGIGKSTLFHFLEAQLGRALCIMHLSISCHALT
jgi:hypothetical protein